MEWVVSESLPCAVAQTDHGYATCQYYQNYAVIPFIYIDYIICSWSKTNTFHHLPMRCTAVSATSWYESGLAMGDYDHSSPTRDIKSAAIHFSKRGKQLTNKTDHQ